MKIRTLAWRNLWRRKRRTFITAFSIGFGVMLAVTFTGAGDYGDNNMINAGARMGWGHVTIAPRGYTQTPSLDKRLSHASEIRLAVLNLPEVSGAIVRIMGQAMFVSARKTVGGMFLAIDPSQESSEQNLFLSAIIEGEVFPNTNGRGVVIGYKMAEKLGLKLRKKLVYTTTDVHGEIVSEIARVSGIFKTGVDEVDGAMVLFPIDTIRQTLNYQSDEATIVAITIDDQRDALQQRDAIAKQIQNKSREVLSWQKTQPDLAGIIAIDRAGNVISQALVGLLIAAGIFNTLLMGVIERTKEFGVMLAIGMSPLTLFKLVLGESLFLAIVGLIVGVIITTPWYIYLHHVGIDFTGAIGDDYNAGGVLIDPIFKIKLYKESLSGILIALFSLTLFSGLYPAWRAAGVPPVESLKTA